MDDKIRRFLELIARKQYLTESKEKLDEEIKSNAMMLFAKAFDGDIEKKVQGSVAIIDSWIQEIDNEINEISPYIKNEYYEKAVADYIANIKNKAENIAKDIIDNEKETLNQK